jgi:uncharacterized protein YaeQ
VPRHCLRLLGGHVRQQSCTDGDKHTVAAHASRRGRVWPVRATRSSAQLGNLRADFLCLQKVLQIDCLLK